MFDLHIYRDGAKPPLPFHYQIQSFVRMMWSDGDDYDIDYGLNAPSSSMVVVLANGNTLISHVEVICTALELAGQSYKCYGLSGVMTYPAFRKRGFAGQVIDTAAALIREDPEADVALLWTAHHNVPFYVAHGWEAMPNLMTLTGDRTQPDVFDEEMRMMLFLSEKGKAARPAFEQGRVYVGQEHW